MVGKNVFLIVLIIIMLLLGYGVYHYHNKVAEMETELNINKQNNVALRDSIQETTNKVGDLEYSKSLLVVERDQLKKVNAMLDAEAKKERYKVNALASTIIVLKGRITELESGVTYIPPTETETDSTYKVNWNIFEEFDKDNNRRISGYTTFGLDRSTFKLKNVNSYLTEDNIKLKLIQGLRERNDVVEIFARSNYPGFGVNDMHVAIIDPKTHPVLSKFTNNKPKVFGLSFYTGYGITYNFKTMTASHGYQIGGGFYWKPNLF